MNESDSVPRRKGSRVSEKDSCLSKKDSSLTCHFLVKKIIYLAPSISIIYRFRFFNRHCKKGANHI